MATSLGIYKELSQVLPLYVENIILPLPTPAVVIFIVKGILFPGDFVKGTVYMPVAVPIFHLTLLNSLSDIIFPPVPSVVIALAALLLITR